MKEKLLAALKTKFQGVQEATLERIATKKAETVTEEDQVQTVVDGMSYDDIIQSETDYRVGQASKTAREKAVKEYEQKHNLKDGKPQTKKGDDDDEDDPPAGGEGEEKVPKWAQKLIKENSELKNTIQGITKSQEVGTKKQQAQALLEKSKIPENLRSKWINRIDLESDTPLEEQVTELETEYVDLRQESINTAVKEGNLAPGSGAGKEVEKEELDGYLNDKFPSEAEK